MKILTIKTINRLFIYFILSLTTFILVNCGESEELKNKRVDNDILLVPSSFEILKTSYTQNEATVVVDEEFIFPDYTEFKKYTFYLHRYGAVWTIYNYEVRNLGTR